MFIFVCHLTVNESHIKSHGGKLQGTGAAVVASHGLSCVSAFGIFPDQALNLCLLHWQADS